LSFTDVFWDFNAVLTVNEYRGAFKVRQP